MYGINFDIAAFSANIVVVVFWYIVVVVPCLVVFCPCLCAAWLGGVFASNFGIIYFFKETTKIFLNMDNKVIGLRFSIDPFGLPDFCFTVITPCLILPSRSPVLAISL